jgi:hypothetical protein
METIGRQWGDLQYTERRMEDTLNYETAHRLEFRRRHIIEFLRIGLVQGQRSKHTKSFAYSFSMRHAFVVIGIRMYARLMMSSHVQIG